MSTNDSIPVDGELWFKRNITVNQHGKRVCAYTEKGLGSRLSVFILLLVSLLCFVTCRKSSVDHIGNEKIQNYDTLIENAVTWALANKHRLDYQYHCLAFVEDAYEQSNMIEMFGGSSAKESADLYGTTTTTEPKRGDFVFYNATGPIDGNTKNWGHVGLCIGNNLIIHTWNIIRIDNYLYVESLHNAPGWSQPEYIGWVSPERFLQGSTDKKYTK